MVNIFVGNLDFQTTQDDLEANFSQYGTVERVTIITDHDTGLPRGFAFVEMTDPQEAATAIHKLNGVELHRRPMNVNEARPKHTGAGRRSSGGDRGRGERW